MNNSNHKFICSSSHFHSEDDMGFFFERTNRNHLLVGEKPGQNKIRNLSIGVAGLGGTGSNIAEQLVRVGVGQLRIADPKSLDASNINRQVIASKKNIGVKKVVASSDELRSISDDFELVCYDQGITKENVEEFVLGCDAIVDEINVFPLDIHVLLHQAARKYNIPVYNSYGVGFGIHFYKFHGSNYTFEDFLLNETHRFNCPSAEFPVDRIGLPFANYFSDHLKEEFVARISCGKVPLFGASTLLGHSLVVTRMILDLITPAKTEHAYQSLSSISNTPVMPRFLVLDPVDVSFYECSAFEGQIRTINSFSDFSPESIRRVKIMLNLAVKKNLIRIRDKGWLDAKLKEDRVYAILADDKLISCVVLNPYQHCCHGELALWKNSEGRTLLQSLLVKESSKYKEGIYGDMFKSNKVAFKFYSEIPQVSFIHYNTINSEMYHELNLNHSSEYHYIKIQG